MTTYTMDGIVKEVMDEQVFPSGFAKREFVVTTQDEKYPQDVKFEALKDRMSILEGVGAGDDVTVTFDLRGSEYKEKYYVNLVAWKLDKRVGDGEESEIPPITPPVSKYDDDFDDLF